MRITVIKVSNIRHMQSLITQLMSACQSEQKRA